MRAIRQPYRQFRDPPHRKNRRPGVNRRIAVLANSALSYTWRHILPNIHGKSFFSSAYLEFGELCIYNIYAFSLSVDREL